MRRILLWTAPALWLAACATTPATQAEYRPHPASERLPPQTPRAVVSAHRQYFDQRTQRYYYFDAKAKAYFWEDGSPRY